MANTPIRTIRVPDEVWELALAKAAMEGRTVTDVVLKCLVRYGRTPPSSTAARRA